MFNNLKLGLGNFILICFNQLVYPYRSISITGVFLLVTIVLQILSGIMVSFSFVCEPMMVPMSREEEDMSDLYTDDFFWMHERGVDVIFILMYVHLFRKLYLRSYSHDQETAWKSGTLMFLVIHGIIFFGLVLCCTHLSDITLTIASNIVKTFCLKYGKLYWFLFTDQTLNVDTVIRLAYLHYIMPFFLIYLGFVHASDMHYGWKDSLVLSSDRILFFWLNDVIKNELMGYFNLFVLFSLLCFYFYSDNEPLSYELFMWGDLGIINDVRFLSVAPHWYFRPYMGWLILCPHHYIGVFGLVYFMVLLYFQPNIQGSNSSKSRNSRYSFMGYTENSFFNRLLFFIFTLSVLYTGSFLPYGRFYIASGGNIMSTLSYLFIFIYLSVPTNYVLRLRLSIPFNQNKFNILSN